MAEQSSVQAAANDSEDENQPIVKEMGEPKEALDHEDAQEEDAEEESDSVKVTKKKKRKLRSKFIDDAAGVEGEEEQEDEEDEAEAELLAAEQEKEEEGEGEGEEEDGEEVSHSRRKGRKKKKRRMEDKLDKDDIEMLREQGVLDPALNDKEMDMDVSSSEEESEEDEDNEGGGGGAGKRRKKRLHKSRKPHFRFEDTTQQQEEQFIEPEVRGAPEAEARLDDDDDDGGFIVHDEGEAGYGVYDDSLVETDAATEEALKIFGPDFAAFMRLKRGMEKDSDDEEEDVLARHAVMEPRVAEQLSLPKLDPALTVDIPERLQERVFERVHSGLEQARFTQLKQSVSFVGEAGGVEKDTRWHLYLKWRSGRVGKSVSGKEFIKWLQIQPKYAQDRGREEEKSEVEFFEGLVRQHEGKSLEKEAKWIREKIRSHLRPERKGESGDWSVPIIAQVLRLIRFENLETPYIATYREEVFEDLLDVKADLKVPMTLLLHIDRLDAQWDKLEVRRRQLLRRLEKMPTNDKESLADLAKEEHSIRALNDIAREVVSVTSRSRAAEEAEVEETIKREGASERDSKLSVPKKRGRPVKPWPLLKFPQELRGKADLFLEEYLLRPKDFAENIDMGGYHRPGGAAEQSLEDAVAELQCPACPDKLSVLSQLRQEAAQRLGSDALVLCKIRRCYRAMAVVSTEPTLRGIREIDWMHEFASVKRIFRKPVSRLLYEPSEAADHAGSAAARKPQVEHTQYLLMLKAEKEGFIKVKLEVAAQDGADMDEFMLDEAQAPPKLDPLVESLKEHYLTDDVSLNAQEWNNWRLSILQDAVTNYLAPKANRALHADLVKSSSQLVADAAARELERMANVVGYALPEGERAREAVRSQRGGRCNVMAVCVGETNEPSVFVVLDRYGEMLDFLQLSFFKTTIRGGSQGESQKTQRKMYDRRQKDVQNFVDFANKYRPERFVLAAEGSQSRGFKKEMERQLSQLSIKDYSWRVVWMDPTVARIFANSPRGETEFPRYTPLVRQSIALGRHFLNPLAEVASLWFKSEQSQEREIMALSLHPLQDQVDKRLLQNELQSALMRATYCLGVDINLLVDRPWLQAPLQFVAGLGPKTAEAIIGMVTRGMGSLTSRAMLRKDSDEDQEEEDDERGPERNRPGEFKGLGVVCYRNAAGFIRVSGPAEIDEAIKVGATKLDLTRIHPEDLVWYTQVILDALGRDEKQLAVDEHDIQEVMDPKNRKGLVELDLDAFAQSEWEENKTKIKPKLYQIRRELLLPFAHLEGPQRSHDFKEPDDEKLFELLTGETKQTLRRGMIVSGVVMRSHRGNVFVRLDGGVMGMIFWKDLKENYEQELGPRPRPEEIDEFVKKIADSGTLVERARVKRVRYDKFSVDLSTKESDLNDDEKRNRERYHVPLISSDMKCHCRSLEAECRCCKRLDMFLPCDFAWDEGPPLFSSSGRMILDSSARPPSFHSIPVDPYLHNESSLGLHVEDKKLLEKHEPKRGKAKAVRNIQHPMFQNMTGEEAENWLKLRKRGEVVIRPSNKGYDYVTITYKVYHEPSVVYHTEVKELEKPNKMALGAVLQIGEEKFEDLDEVLARYIEPVADYYYKLLSHHKMYFGPEKAVMENLRETRQDEKDQILPYYFWQSQKHYGMFEFLCLPGQTTIQREFIRVTPNGYSYNKKRYTSPSSLLAACKNGVKEKIKRNKMNIKALKKVAQTPGSAPVPDPRLVSGPALKPQGGWKKGMQAKGYFPDEKNWYTGTILDVLPDGKILMSFPNYRPKS
eukprot:g61636.t1